MAQLHFYGYKKRLFGTCILLGALVLTLSSGLVRVPQLYMRLRPLNVTAMCCQ